MCACVEKVRWVEINERGKGGRGRRLENDVIFAFEGENEGVWVGFGNYIVDSWRGWREPREWFVFRKTIFQTGSDECLM